MNDKILKTAEHVSRQYDSLCLYAKCLLHHFNKTECDQVERVDVLESLGKALCRCKVVDDISTDSFWSELPLQAFTDPFAYAKTVKPDDIDGFCADMKHSEFLELVENKQVTA